MNIECVNCQELIYRCRAVGREYTGSAVKAIDFEPIDPKHPQPTDGDAMTCPVCGDRFYYIELGYALLLLEDGSWWPHPPIAHPST